MKTSENKPKNAPKALAKALAVWSTALVLSLSFMGNTYPETDNSGAPTDVGTRPTATITDNVIGYVTPVPLQYATAYTDGTLYYNDDGYYEIEIYDSALSFTAQVFGSYQIYQSPLIVYELRDYLMPMSTYSMFDSGSFTIESQDGQNYIPLTAYEYSIIDRLGSHNEEGTIENSLDWLGDCTPMYSPTTDMEYFYIDYLRLEIYVDTTFVPQPAGCILTYEDGLTPDLTIRPTLYSLIYADFLELRGIVLAPSPTDLLWAPIRNFLTTEIFPGFNIGTVLSIGIGLLCFGLFLKIFVGG